MTKYIYVFGQKFTVKYQPLEKGEHGDCDVDTKQIRINNQDPPDEQAATLLHELIHAAFGVAGWDAILNRKEEACTRMLENALAPLFQLREGVLTDE